jgi:maltodextrin utilization protein YvdJ
MRQCCLTCNLRFLLRVLSQRVDASIFVVNVVMFAGIAGFMIYLTKKERDLKEKEFFSD